MGFYKGQVVLKAPVVLFSHMWKQFIPSETIVIDKLVIPPMVDFDSMMITRDGGISSNAA